MFDIKEELKNLPDNPGVYLMHDSSGKIIYVGKAKILKNRVRQYFMNSKNHAPKVRAMVSNIAYFEYIVTDSEVEALVLECNLIKKHMPKYNILLKDDKQYPYIKVTMNEDYPKVFMTRKIEKDGAKYFGPYMGVNTIRNTLEVIQKIFMPPVCKRKFPQDIGKGRPCLNYHIKNCFAPCRGNVSREEFRSVFSDICKFLQEDHRKLIDELTAQMKAASARLDFEKAAVIRDKIKAICDIDEKQKIIFTDGDFNRDILAIFHEEERAHIAVFFVRNSKIVGRETYRMDDVAQTDDSEILGSFINSFYTGDITLPEEIICEYDIEDREIVEQMLSQIRGKKVKITVPQKGEKKNLVLMVKKNARIAYENDKIREIRESRGSILTLTAETLGLKTEPKRIEAYDISNISGADSVGAMVVFENGRANKSKYRLFKIKTVEGSDDYTSTKEVIYRRFRRALEEREAINSGEMLEANAKFLPHPDLILADGGIGHVNAICDMLELMDIDIPVYGMVKDDKHRTRGIIDREGCEIEMSPIGSVFNFFTVIQDEVHRFAISHFRSLHSKTSFKSELDDIPGVGKVRRLKLMEYFGGIDKIKLASCEELKKTVDSKTANAVWNYFHGE